MPLMVWTRRKMFSRIFGVVGLLLEAHQLDVDRVETFVGLGQKFPQQVVHETAFAPAGPAPSGRPWEGQCVVEG